jgi:5-methylcytosine-specific restriction protein A
MMSNNKRVIITGIKEALILEHGSTCNSCKQRDIYVVLDHIVPLSQGGDGRISNFQLLCKSCHDLKTKNERLKAKRKSVKNE